MQMTRQDPGSKTSYPVYDALCKLVWALNKVWTFVTHVRPHVDEIFAIWLVVRFGVSANRFKVREDDPLANIQFWGGGGKTPDGRSWEAHARENEIILGTVPKSEFNPDHEQFGVKARKGLCAASAMDEFLAIIDLVARELLAAVVDNDLRGGKHPMGLSRLVQSMYQAGYDPKQVIYWAMRALDALYDQRCSKQAPPKVDGRANLVFPGTGMDRAAELAALYLLRMYRQDLLEQFGVVELIKIKAAGKDRRGRSWSSFALAQAVAGYDASKNASVLDWTLKFVGKHKYMPAKGLRRDIEELRAGVFDPITAVLNFTSVIDALTATWAPYSDLVDWSFAAFDARFKSSQSFIYALTDVEKAEQGDGVSMVDWEGTPVKILAVQSDNHQIIGAAYKRGADVLVVRSRSKHISIFFNKATVGLRPASLALSAGDIIEEIRKRAFTRMGLKIDNLAALRSPGSLEILLEWYYHPELMALLNGSDAAPDVKPTEETLSSIVEIIVSKMNKPLLDKPAL